MHTNDKLTTVCNALHLNTVGGRRVETGGCYDMARLKMYLKYHVALRCVYTCVRVRVRVHEKFWIVSHCHGVSVSVCVSVKVNGSM